MKSLAWKIVVGVLIGLLLMVLEMRSAALCHDHLPNDSTGCHHGAALTVEDGVAVCRCEVRP